MKTDSSVIILLFVIALSLVVKVVWFNWRPEEMRKKCYEEVKKKDDLSRDFAFRDCINKLGISQ